MQTRTQSNSTATLAPTRKSPSPTTFAIVTTAAAAGMLPHARPALHARWQCQWHTPTVAYAT